MEYDVSGQAETDEDILTFDVPDEALERAATVTDRQVMTIGICTQWYHCSWPQVPAHG